MVWLCQWGSLSICNTIIVKINDGQCSEICGTNHTSTRVHQSIPKETQCFNIVWSIRPTSIDDKQASKICHIEYHKET